MACAVACGPCCGVILEKLEKQEANCIVKVVGHLVQILNPCLFLPPLYKTFVLQISTWMLLLLFLFLLI